MKKILLPTLLLGAVSISLSSLASDLPPLRQRLHALPFKIAYETYVNNNWEIFVTNPDGSEPFNLTKTPDQHEHYPQVSPDRKSTRLNSSHSAKSRMPSSA